MCGGRRTIRCRSPAGVSPVRTRARISGQSGRSRRASARSLGQRPLQVALDVVGQGPQRRDVDDVGLIAQLSGQGQAQEPVEAGQERGQRLARARSERRSGYPAASGWWASQAAALRWARKSVPETNAASAGEKLHVACGQTLFMVRGGGATRRHKYTEYHPTWEAGGRGASRRSRI